MKCYSLMKFLPRSFSQIRYVVKQKLFFLAGIQIQAFKNTNYVLICNFFPHVDYRYTIESIGTQSNPAQQSTNYLLSQPWRRLCGPFLPHNLHKVDRILLNQMHKLENNFFVHSKYKLQINCRSQIKLFQKKNIQWCKKPWYRIRW